MEPFLSDRISVITASYLVYASMVSKIGVNLSLI